METRGKAGFTLIELIIVIAILAIITVIGIGKFADFRQESARRANVTNLANIGRTINTELARTDRLTDFFNYLESLIDVSSAGDYRGAEGQYVWSQAWYDGAGGIIPGIYCGIKTTTAVQNAQGQTTGVVSALATAHEENGGLGDFAAKLGIYFLTQKEVASLKAAGLRIVLRHNYSNGQASQTLKYVDSGEGLHTCNGGPGFRADMSAYYPIVLTNGSAVAVLDPVKNESVYRQLGLDFAATNTIAGLQSAQPESYFEKGVCHRLLAFGLGRESEVTTRLFENPPRCPTRDQTHYRNYILLFEMRNGTGNRGTTVRFVGVLDPEGNTLQQAQYAADWSS